MESWPTAIAYLLMLIFTISHHESNHIKCELYAIQLHADQQRFSRNSDAHRTIHGLYRFDFVCCACLPACLWCEKVVTKCLLVQPLNLSFFVASIVSAGSFNKPFWSEKKKEETQGRERWCVCVCVWMTATNTPLERNIQWVPTRQRRRQRQRQQQWQQYRKVHVVCSFACHLLLQVQWVFFCVQRNFYLCFRYSSGLQVSLNLRSVYLLIHSHSSWYFVVLAVAFQFVLSLHVPTILQWNAATIASDVNWYEIHCD